MVILPDLGLCRIKIRRSFLLKRSKRRSCLDPESGQAIWDRAVCALTCTLSYTMSKTDDRMILRPVSQDSPGSVSSGGDPRRKISKAVAPRDTNHRNRNSPGTVFWCGRRDLNSRTTELMVSRVVGLEAHWTPVLCPRPG